jgi:hypothetical protein
VVIRFHAMREAPSSAARTPTPREGAVRCPNRLLSESRPATMFPSSMFFSSSWRIAGIALRARGPWEHARFSMAEQSATAGVNRRTLLSASRCASSRISDGSVALRIAAIWALVGPLSASASGRICRAVRKKATERHASSLWVACEAGIPRTCFAPTRALGL